MADSMGKIDFQGIANFLEMNDDILDLIRGYKILKTVHHELWFSGEVSQETRNKIDDYFESKSINLKI